MNNVKQLLFVDDDTRLLQGLKRLLRRKRKHWQMFFAPSGEDAIEIVKREKINVIVCDMRMPGMDGVSVLKTVSKISPDTIRFVLSGHACNELVMKVTLFAHVFLAKPCNQDHLVCVLERACAIHDSISDLFTRKIIHQIGCLPCIPDVYDSLLAELKSDTPSPERIGDIAASDPSMSLKFLQLVNTAFFGLPREVSCVRQAVNILGVETVSSIVLSAHVFKPIESELLNKSGLNSLYKHLNHTSSIARVMAQYVELSVIKVNAAVTAGLLHNIGTLVIAIYAPTLYQELLESQKGDSNNKTLEKDTYNVSTSEIGAYLLGVWGLPEEIVSGVAFCKHPDLDDSPSGIMSLSSIVHIASKTATLLERNHLDIEFFDIDTLKKLGAIDELDNYINTGMLPTLNSDFIAQAELVTNDGRV